MALELPIRSVIIKEYPHAGIFSSTKYQACIYFNDDHNEYCYAGTIRSLRKELERKYGELMTKELFPILYSSQAITLYRTGE